MHKEISKEIEVENKVQITLSCEGLPIPKPVFSIETSRKENLSLNSLKKSSDSTLS